jgi:uncharacterized iron-regulated protein
LGIDISIGARILNEIKQWQRWLGKKWGSEKKAYNEFVRIAKAQTAPIINSSFEGVMG